MLSVLLNNRRLAAWLVVAGAVHLILSASGTAHYFCPFHAVTGLPCPGCGLTRGVGCMLRGDWAGMMAAHPFTPYFVFLAAVMAVAVILPRNWRKNLALAAASFEARTHANTVVLLSFVIFGVLRMALVGSLG
jgi:hypothetical protein